MSLPRFSRALHHHMLPLMRMFSPLLAPPDIDCLLDANCINVPPLPLPSFAPHASTYAACCLCLRQRGPVASTCATGGTASRLPSARFTDPARVYQWCGRPDPPVPPPTSSSVPWPAPMTSHWCTIRSPFIMTPTTSTRWSHVTRSMSFDQWIS